MPTYSYRCRECSHEFDRVQRITEDPIRTCPACGKDEAQRQINSGNFILKGQGWYSDLYSGSSNKKSGASDSSTSTTSATTPSSTTSTASTTPATSTTTSAASTTSTTSTTTPSTSS